MTKFRIEREEKTIGFELHTFDGPSHWHVDKGKQAGILPGLFPVRKTDEKILITKIDFSKVEDKR